MESGISVIVCCYNSAQRLPATIEHLSLQDVPAGTKWEVIVVNNNSTDNTEQVATDLISQYLLPKNIEAIVVNEPIPGLTAAREKGIAEAKYSYVLFCDDDNWLAADFIRRLSKYLVQYKDVNIGVIGSFGTAVGEVDLPSWMPRFESWYATGSQSDTDGDITQKRPVVFGAASLLNKAAYLKIREQGFRSYLSDRLGGSLSSGGDLEICMALALSGYRIFYFSDLRFQHYLNAQRLQKSYITKMSREGAKSMVSLSAYNYLWNNIQRQPKHFSIIHLSSLHLLRLPRILGDLIKAKLGKDEDKLFEKRVALLDELNAWKTRIALRKRMKEQYFSLRESKWLQSRLPQPTSSL